MIGDLHCVFCCLYCVVICCNFLRTWIDWHMAVVVMRSLMTCFNTGQQINLWFAAVISEFHISVQCSADLWSLNLWSLNLIGIFSAICSVRYIFLGDYMPFSQSRVGPDCCHHWCSLSGRGALPDSLVAGRNLKSRREGENTLGLSITQGTRKCVSGDWRIMFHGFCAIMLGRHSHWCSRL